MYVYGKNPLVNTQEAFKIDYGRRVVFSSPQGGALTYKFGGYIDVVRATVAWGKTWYENILRYMFSSKIHCFWLPLVLFAGRLRLPLELKGLDLDAHGRRPGEGNPS